MSLAGADENPADENINWVSFLNISKSEMIFTIGCLLLASRSHGAVSGRETCIQQWKYTRLLWNDNGDRLPESIMRQMLQICFKEGSIKMCGQPLWLLYGRSACAELIKGKHPEFPDVSYSECCDSLARSGFYCLQLPKIWPPCRCMKSYLCPARNTLTFVLTTAIMYVVFSAAVRIRLRAFLTTAHVTYTHQFNGIMRDKERWKVITKN